MAGRGVYWLIIVIHRDVNSEVVGESAGCWGRRWWTPPGKELEKLQTDAVFALGLKRLKERNCNGIKIFKWHTVFEDTYILDSWNIYSLVGLIWEWQCPCRIIFPKWLSSLTSLFMKKLRLTELVGNVTMPFSPWELVPLLPFSKYHDPSCFPLIRINMLSYFLDLVVTIAFQWKLGNSCWKKKSTHGYVFFLSWS